MIWHNWALPAAITQNLLSYLGMEYTDLVSVCLRFDGVFGPCALIRGKEL